jgi:hypothetical protein
VQRHRHARKEHDRQGEKRQLAHATDFVQSLTHNRKTDVPQVTVMERFGRGIIADQLTEVSSICFVSLSYIVGDRTAAAKKIHETHEAEIVLFVLFRVISWIAWVNREQTLNEDLF